MLDMDVLKAYVREAKDEELSQKINAKLWVKLVLSNLKYIYEDWWIVSLENGIPASESFTVHDMTCDKDDCSEHMKGIQRFKLYSKVIKKI